MQVKILPNSVVWALGWGRTSLHSTESSNVLKNVRLKIIDEKYCGSITINEFCIGNFKTLNSEAIICKLLISSFTLMHFYHFFRKFFLFLIIKFSY